MVGTLCGNSVARFCTEDKVLCGCAPASLQQQRKHFSSYSQMSLQNSETRIAGQNPVLKLDVLLLEAHSSLVLIYGCRLSHLTVDLSWAVRLTTLGQGCCTCNCCFHEAALAVSF